MKLGEFIGRLDRLQRSLRFRVIATIVVVVLGAAGVGLAFTHGSGSEVERLGEAERLALQNLDAEQASLEAIGEPIPVGDPRRDRFNALFEEAFRVSAEAAAARLQAAKDGDGVLRLFITDAGPFLAIVAAGVALGAVWLGFGLTYVGLAGVVAGIAYPLTLFEGTREFGLIGIGAAVLVVALLAALEAAKLALGGGTPVLAVARNVLIEALRARIGLIFVVALVLLLALLPNVLNEDQPLRYRVQQWIQYGLGLGYLLLALMTVFFGVATVAFEQRDRIIWQTVSKPVRAGSYILGKWLGVMVLNVVLMGTIAAGVLVFSLYMERLPANGEAAYHVTLGDGAQIRPGVNTQLVPEFRTKDRRLLEEEVLVARVGIQPLPPEINNEAIAQVLEARVRAELEQTPGFIDNAETRERLLNELLGVALERARTIPPGRSRFFVWEGLGYLKADAERQPRLTLRYTFDAGSNDPADVYKMRFFFNGQAWPLPEGFGIEQSLEEGVQPITLGTAQLLPFPTDFIDENGRLVIEVQSAFSNPREGNFGPGGIEVLYSAGGYTVNFFRSMTVLLVQLAFLAAVAVAAAAFLSYPVAVLLTFGAFLGTAMAGYFGRALLDYSTTTREGDALIFNSAAAAITRVVQLVFGPFANVKPIERLADGRLISWSDLVGTMIVIGVVSLVVLGVGVLVFRRRELALYSGH